MKYQKLLFIIALTILNLSAFHYFKFYKQYVSMGDSWGYYTHLVSPFIYHDMGDYKATTKGTKLAYPNFGDPFIDKYGVRECPKTGKFVVKYTNGVAMMLLPFWSIGHAYAKFSHCSADGFSLPYLLAIGWGIIFWVSLGSYYLLCVLRRYFSAFVSGFTIVILLFGTNLFYNTTYNSIMSHALLYTCYAVLVYQTDTYYKNPTQKRLILLAVAATMISLIRLNEIYCILLPLLWGVTSIDLLKARFQWIFAHIKQYIVAAAVGFTVFIPQIIYWKALTGSFLYYAYVGETFDFAHPHIYEGWLSYTNGWLVWSPVMVLSLLGIVAMYRYAKNAFLPLILILPLHTYIIYSWWCFQYINGFGSRPMEHIYPLLAFGVGSLLTFLYKHKITSALITIFAVFCIGLTVFQVWQQKEGLIFTEMTNKGFYWGMFCKTRSSRNAIVGYASDEVQPQQVTVLKSIFKSDFNDITNPKNVMQAQNNSLMRCLQQQCDTITTLDIDDKLDAAYFNIRFKNLFHADAVNGNFWDLPLLIFRFKDANGNDLCDRSLKPHILSGNTNHSIWTQGTPDICEPIEYNMSIHQRSKVKKILVCTWNPQAKPFYIDDLEVNLAK